MEDVVQLVRGVVLVVATVTVRADGSMSWPANRAMIGTGFDVEIGDPI